MNEPNENTNTDSEINTDPYTNVSAGMTCDENNFRFNLGYMIYENYEIDQNNVTYTISDDSIQVNLPAIQKEISDDVPERKYGFVTVEVGDRSVFKDRQMYNITLKNGTVVGTFAFEDEKLYTFTPAYIQGIKIKSEKKQIKAYAQAGTGVEMVYTIDTANATTSKSFDENNTYTISVPERKLDYKEPIPLPMLISVHEFDIANSSKLKNGKYTVKINDMEASFIIIAGTVVWISNAGEYWAVNLKNLK
ncbi:hypothetical protein [Methanimicrococcus hacksteinii]|nr:hypothetical protein [Methanimicrococcus sp. At1]